MKKILIYGFWGMNNLGDDLLFCEALKKIPAIYELYVFLPPSHNTNINREKNIESFISIRNFFIIRNRKDILKKTFYGIYYAGGGLFPSRTFSIKNMLSLYLLGITSKYKIMNGCGIVPKKESVFFSYFLKGFNYISVRDCLSKNYVESLGHKAINCGDLYWGNNQTTENTTKKDKTCLICLANPFSKEELSNPVTKLRYAKFLTDIAEIINTIISKGYVIDFLPFFQLSDEILINDLRVTKDIKGKILIQGTDYTIDTIDNLFSQYEIGFCMRYHSILLSIKNRLPFLAINYDFKSEMLLKEAGLENYGIRYGIRESQFFGEEIDLDVAKMKSILNSIYNNKIEIIEKSIVYRKQKHESVLQNYNNIFHLLNK